MAGFSIKLSGDWGRAQSIVDGMGAKFKAAAEQAMMKEAHRLRGLMVKGIAGGAPGGKPFAPLSAMTIAIRKFKGFGGSKPLIWTGALRGGITVQKVGTGVFVGIRRNAKRKDGKSLVNIAELHEFGKTFQVRITNKMRRFLFAVMRSAGITPAGKSKGGTRGMLTIRIPARPFITPVVEAEGKPADVQRRFWDNVSKAMGYDLGKP